jgi:hypothetical protein
MEKGNEYANPLSCFNKAHPNEQLFVLLGRDMAAPATIRAWAAARIALGLNHEGDIQIQVALRTAVIMERERHYLRQEMGLPLVE